MITKHPLTDTICDQIQDSIHPCDPDNMRAAADWQLEQVIKALNQCKEEKRSCIEVMYLFHEKLEAMRPTTQENN